MRLIDADELMKAIEKKDAEPFYEHKGEDWHVGLSFAEDLVWEQPTIEVPKWISCNEKLPDHYRDVLVTGIEAFSNKRICRVMCWDVDRWRPCNYAPSIHWDAWMELPEPYGGEQDG